MLRERYRRTVQTGNFYGIVSCAMSGWCSLVCIKICNISLHWKHKKHWKIFVQKCYWMSQQIRCLQAEEHQGNWTIYVQSKNAILIWRPFNNCIIDLFVPRPISIPSCDKLSLRNSGTQNCFVSEVYRKALFTPHRFHKRTVWKCSVWAYHSHRNVFLSGTIWKRFHTIALRRLRYAVFVWKYIHNVFGRKRYDVNGVLRAIHEGCPHPGA